MPPADDDPVLLRGSADRKVATVREEVPFALALLSLEARLDRDFDEFEGCQLTFELGWRELSEGELIELETLLALRDVKLEGIVCANHRTRRLAESRGHRAIIGRLGLAQHQGRTIKDSAGRTFSRPRESRSGEAASRDAQKGGAGGAEPLRRMDPGLGSAREGQAARPPASEERDVALEEPTVFLRRNLRAGRRLAFRGNVVVIGDIEAGAEIEAEGDILVMGSLAGLAHAGSRGRRGASVTAFDLQGAHVRIGPHEWRFHGDGDPMALAGPVRIRVVDGELAIELYHG